MRNSKSNRGDQQQPQSILEVRLCLHHVATLTFPLPPLAYPIKTPTFAYQAKALLVLLVHAAADVVCVCSTITTIVTGQQRDMYLS